MSQTSQRVSKLSRRAGRGSRPPPAPVLELPDLDTSDDFTPSLSFARSRSRSTLSQSSCAAEPSSSQSQQLSGNISDAIRATSVSFCGVLDSFVHKSSSGVQPPTSDVKQTINGVQKPPSGVQKSASGDQKQSSDVQEPSAGAGRSRRTRQATRAATRSTRSSRSTRQSAAVPTESALPGAESEGHTSAPLPVVDLSRFARTASTSSAVSKPVQSLSKEPSLSTSNAVGSADVVPSASPSPAVCASPSAPPAAVAPVAAPAAPAAAAAVADCPVCLQPLPSASARLAHLKLCGERRGLSPAQLLAAVRLQQKQAGERAAAGLPPTRAAPPAARRTRTGQQGRRRGAAAAAAAAAPSAAGDADLQMALAVSASLRDEEERTRRLAESQLLELGLGQEVEAARDSGAAVPPEPTVPAVLQTADGPPAGRSRGRGGRRKAAADTVLVTQTKEERQRRLCEKVAQLLAWEEEVPVESRRLRSGKGSPRPAPAWEKAAQLHTSEGDYYVPELVGLVEPCTAPVTSLLKDVADIPGRSSLTQRGPGNDRGSGSEAEDADMETEDAAGATQAALLLLAGDSDSQYSQFPADSESESAQPPADTDDSETVGVSTGQVAPPADSSVLKSEDGDAAESVTVSGVSKTGQGDKMTAGLPEDGSLSRSVKSSLANADAGSGRNSESPSKRTKASRSPHAPCGIVDEVEITPAGAMNTAYKLSTPAVYPSDGEDKACVSSPTRKGAERSPSGRREARSGLADGGAGSSSGQAGDVSVPGRDRTEQGSAPPGPPAAAASSATTSRDSAAVGSDPPSLASSPRRIPSTPDSVSCCSPAPGSSPILPASPDFNRTGDAAAGRRSDSPGPGPYRSAALSSVGGACFSAAQPCGLGVALLDLLLTGGGPPTASLVCCDGPVAVHSAVLAVRCPPLYRAVTEAGGRLSLPEVGHRAAAALVRLLYLGETECTAGDAPLPQLLLLAERFGLAELERHLREEHGVTEPAAGPVRRPSPTPAPSPAPAPPLSPELFDLTGSDGVEEMELGSPAGGAAPGPGSGCGQSPRRGSDSDVICTPGQSPERSGGQINMDSPCGLTISPARAGETSRRDEKTPTAGDKTPLRDKRATPPGREASSGSGDATEATEPAPSTPRRGQKRPSVTPRRPGSSEDICEVFSSLSKRRRTASPFGGAEQPASSASEELRLASPAVRAPRAASPASQELVSRSLEPRPSSTDSDIEILDDVPVVFRQRLKSPRRSSGRRERSPRRSAGRMEGDKSPVAAAKRSGGGQDARSEASPVKTPLAAAGSREQSPIGDVSLLSSPPLSQAQPRRQSGCGNDSFASSPLISRRHEQDSRDRELPATPSSKRLVSGTKETDSPARSQQLVSTPDSPVPDRDSSLVSMPPYSPELPVMSSLHSPEPASPVPPSPRARRRSASPTSPSPFSHQRSASPVSLPSPGARRRSATPPRSPAGSSSRGVSPGPDAVSSPLASPPPASPPSASPPPASPPPADVWDGFEDGGYIELMEPPSPLGTPQPPAAESIPNTAAGSSPIPAPPSGPRPSLDSSELWQDSSLLAGYTTPTAAEKTADSRRTDSGTPRVRSSDSGTSRARPSDTGASRVRPSGSRASRRHHKDAGTPGAGSKDAGAPGVVPEDAGTPDTGMPPPPQRTPVNQYRVVLRDSNTPRPNYVLMLTPELKRELARIGVKPISRRKAVALLSHIYEETHPPASTGGGRGTSRSVPSASIATARVASSTSTTTTTSKSATSASTAATSKTSKVSKASVSTAGGSSTALPAASSHSGSSADRPPPSDGSSSNSSSSTCRPARSDGSSSSSSAARPSVSSSAFRPAPSGRSSSPAVQSAPSSRGPELDGDRFARRGVASREPRSRSDSDSESSGSEGAAARLEEVFGRLGERLDRKEEEEEEEEITPSQAACAASLPEALRSYIMSRQELYHQVLTYEPVWLESLHRDLRQTGLKLNIAQLMNFLDEQCITFRTENSGRRRKSPKKKRSPKKASPKKRGPSQKKKSPRKKVD